MKDKKMLLGLLLVLGLGGGALGYEYHTGAFDTWEDRTEAIQQSFADQLTGQAPAEIIQGFSACLAKGGVALADELKCAVPAPDVDAREAVQACVETNGAQQQLAMLMITCVMQAQSGGFSSPEE